MELSAAAIGSILWTIDRNETGVIPVEVFSITKIADERGERIVFGVRETDEGGCTFESEDVIGEDLFSCEASAAAHFAADIERGKARFEERQAQRQRSKQQRLARLRNELEAIQAEIKRIESI